MTNKKRVDLSKNKTKLSAIKQNVYVWSYASRVFRMWRVGAHYTSQLAPGPEYLTAGGASPWHWSSPVNVNLETWSTAQSTWETLQDQRCTPTPSKSSQHFPSAIYPKTPRPFTHRAVSTKQCSGDFWGSSCHVFCIVLTGENNERPTRLLIRMN